VENEIQIVDVSLSIRRFFIALLWLSADGCGLHTIETFRPDLRHAELTFSDEFDGDTIDSSKWNAISRILYSNGALNSYNPAMVSVANGHLRLDLQRVPHLGKSYSGGEIDSRGNSTVILKRALKCRVGQDSMHHGGYGLCLISGRLKSTLWKSKAVNRRRHI
jgi:hypothetical protein